MKKYKEKLKELGMESEFYEWLSNERKVPFSDLKKGIKFFVKEGPYSGKVGIITGVGVWGEGEKAFITKIDTKETIYLREKDYHLVKLL